MERFLIRLESPASSSQAAPAVRDRPTAAAEIHTQTLPASQTTVIQSLSTSELLDVNLQALLQQLTHNIAQEVGRIAQKLRGEIDHLGEHTDI